MLDAIGAAQYLISEIVYSHSSFEILHQQVGDVRQSPLELSDTIIDRGECALPAEPYFSSGSGPGAGNIYTCRVMVSPDFRMTGFRSNATGLPG